MESVEVTTGDITTFEASAIVNAANYRLRRGSGIDGAIHRAAGDRLQQELTKNWPRGGDVGGAYTTDAYQINTTEYVIHAVGPDYNAVQGIEANNQLRSAYINSLQRATEIQAESIVFPAISTGIFAFPRAIATGIALTAVRNFIDANPEGTLDRVVFLLLRTADEGLAQYSQQFQ